MKPKKIPKNLSKKILLIKEEELNINLPTEKTKNFDEINTIMQPMIR